MAFNDKTIELKLGQTAVIDLSLMFANAYFNEQNLPQPMPYEEKWVMGFIENCPYWITYTTTANVDTLNSIYLNRGDTFFPNYLLNGTDYLKTITVVPQTVGTFSYTYRYIFYIITEGGVVGFNAQTATLTIKVSPAISNTINRNNYDRVIRLEKNIPKAINFGEDGLYVNDELFVLTSTLPAWITNNVDNQNQTTFWSVNPPAVGTYTFYGDIFQIKLVKPSYIETLLNPRPLKTRVFQGNATITLVVVDSLYEEIDNCCSDENVNIVWLNRQGGRGNFIFTQRKDFNIDIGKKNDYISNDTRKYSEIKDVYNGFSVYATGITKNQLIFLDTLRYSIQCWEFKDNGFIPLYLDIKSFEKYNTKENMYEVKLDFIYAKRINIQRQ